ncbi:hypothetical protein K469DRAFT_590492 [Zopfia rhizophila CBS 207.26]|uniref:Uncharacterized protein n=1 Tax=Zopfia rhizophila CBS 207.26 TaxID=1314779 RepID=A0A6A6DNE9_9PEZI|nr:hypothetical protein K469DRAFT_590492 [Zopfia rhizophila CBS 207.26]
MSGEGRDNPHSWYTKEWNPIFSTDRDFRDYGSYVECTRRPDREGNNLGTFLQDYEDSVPSCKVEEVEEFCQDTHLDVLKSGDGTADRRTAWLDDRSFPRLETNSKGYVRKYQNPLTATKLCQLLKEPRFNNGELPDADRRLIYIANLNPHYIFALTETASFHQVSVLRDAIWKHLALQTSIRVKVPSGKYNIFQLEFQIPYFALRILPFPAGHPQRTVPNKTPPRQWTDLSFLNRQILNSQGKKQYGMYEAQISLVICGPDEKRWVGYAFVDRYFNGEDLEEDDFSYDGVQEDPIATDFEVDTNLPIIDANLPKWNPREYFLNIVEFRMAQVLKEWEGLVRKVQRSVRDYVC